MRRLGGLLVLSAVACVPAQTVPLVAPTPCDHCAPRPHPARLYAGTMAVERVLLTMKLWDFSSPSGAKEPPSGPKPNVASTLPPTEVLGADLTTEQLGELEEKWGKPFALDAVDARVWSESRGPFVAELDAAWVRTGASGTLVADRVGTVSLGVLAGTYADYVASFAPGAMFGPSDTWPALLDARDAELSVLGPRIRAALVADAVKQLAGYRDTAGERFVSGYPKVLFEKTSMAGKVTLPRVALHAAAVVEARVREGVDGTLPMALLWTLLEREEHRLVLATRPLRPKTAP